MSAVRIHEAFKIENNVELLLEQHVLALADSADPVNSESVLGTSSTSQSFLSTPVTKVFYKGVN